MTDQYAINDFSQRPDLAHLPSDPALRVKAMESLLLEKDLVKAEIIDAYIGKFEKEVGPHNGARLVARTWVDLKFKAKILKNSTRAVREMGYRR